MSSIELTPDSINPTLNESNYDGKKI